MATPTHPIPPSGAQVLLQKNILHSRCNSGSMRSQSADKCKSLRTKLLKKHKWKKVYRTSLYFTFIRSEFVRNEPINRSLIKTCVRSQICHVGDFFAEFINRPPLDLTSTDDTYFPLYHHHQSSAYFWPLWTFLILKMTGLYSRSLSLHQSKRRKQYFGLVGNSWLVRLSGYFQVFVLLLEEILSISMIVYLWKIVDWCFFFSFCFFFW